MRITIHRGAHEIGGSCVELVSAGGSRILLDLGMPLARPDGSEWPKGTALRPSNELRAEGLLPDIRGLYAGDQPSVEGLVLSHSHIDHYGLAHHIHPEVPAFGSPGTLAILRASQLFLPGTAIPTNLRELRAGSPLKIGDFMVTAIPVDHSAPASCAILVEADGQTILYSGDLRAHGPHPSLFAGLCEICTSPDVLILEGTTVGQPAGAHGYSSEAEVQSKLTALFAEHAGLVALAASGQNVDRLVAIYRACLATGRQLVIDPYQAYILHVLVPIFGDLPRFDSPDVRVRFVQSQVGTLKAAGRFDLACEMSRAAKVTREQLYSEPGAYVLLARSNRATLDLLSRLPHPEEVGVVWSMWRGYWDKANPLKTFCATHGIEPHFIHSGGHAHPEDLRRLVDALRPRAVVPIHTQNAAQFREDFPSVALVDDGLQVELTDLPQHIQAHSQKECQTGPARVVVLSDCHGYPQTIRDALAHFAENYGPFVDGTDRLVFAGDFLDRGPDPDGCLEALEEHDAVMLVGNHDQAIGLGYRIADQDEDSRRFEPWIRERLESGRMRLVTVEQGVLISHAGVSSQYQADLDEVCHGDLELFARRLCDEYVEAIRDQLKNGRRTPSPRILDDFAPHRYPTHRGSPGPQRPEDPNGPPPLLTGPPHIVGHRAPEDTRESYRYRGVGIYQIALPYGALDTGYFRYAVIDGGRVSVESNWPPMRPPDGRHSESDHVVRCYSASPGFHRTASKGRARAMSSRSDLEDLFPTLEDDGAPSDLPADLVKRAQGCLLGQLAGDSLGSLVEFESEDSIRWQYPEGVSQLADGGTWGTLAGQPTDDSELALMLARSIIRHGGFDAAEAAVAYAHWYGSSPFDCGNTTAQALRPAHAALVGGDGAEGVAATAKSRASGESQANGALMRVSPLGIFAHGLPAYVCADLARQDALMTHPHEVCQDASAVFVVAIAHAISTGASASETHGFVKEWARGAVGATVRRCLEESAESAPPDFQDHQGWVLIALQNAFWQLLHAPSLEHGVCDTVMRGGDTDTNAAIAGALLGAVHGSDAIPEQWRQAVLSCRPEQGRPGVRRPRPRPFWPVDALLVARVLAELGSLGH